MNKDHDITNADSVFLKEDSESMETEPASSSESLLYPEIPENYFEDKEDGFSKPKSGMQSIMERYEKAKIKPHIGMTDFNNDRDRPCENRPKIGYEIGVKFSF